MWWNSIAAVTSVKGNGTRRWVLPSIPASHFECTAGVTRYGVLHWCCRWKSWMPISPPTHEARNLEKVIKERVKKERMNQRKKERKNQERKKKPPRVSCGCQISGHRSQISQRTRVETVKMFMSQVYMLSRHTLTTLTTLNMIKLGRRTRGAPSSCQGGTRWGRRSTRV